MSKSGSKASLWAKVIGVGIVIGVGGPLATNYVRPTDEELFERYSPELKKKSLEGRTQKQQEFDDFVTQMKEDAKSSKPIWVVQKERQERERKAKEQANRQAATDVKTLKEDLRREAGLPPTTKT